MYEEIIDYLRSCSEGASTGEIAGNFFRISNRSIAEITVKNILSKDNFQDCDGVVCGHLNPLIPWETAALRSLHSRGSRQKN